MPDTEVQLTLFPQMQGEGKRVVLESRTGITQILGLALTQPPDVLRIPIGEGMFIPLNLWKVTQRSYVYREVMAPEGLGVFDQQQE